MNEVERASDPHAWIRPTEHYVALRDQARWFLPVLRILANDSSTYKGSRVDLEFRHNLAALEEALR